MATTRSGSAPVNCNTSDVRYRPGKTARKRKGGKPFESYRTYVKIK